MRKLTMVLQLASVMYAQSELSRGHQTLHLQGSRDIAVSKVNDNLTKMDLLNTTLGFMVGIPQNAKTLRAPTINPRAPHERRWSLPFQEKKGIESFQDNERIRLLNLLLGIDTAVASFQNGLHAFQDQERVRLQVEKEAILSFQDQERSRLLNMVREATDRKTWQSLESFQEQERLRLQTELQAIASFQDQERLRLHSIGRAIDAIHGSAASGAPSALEVTANTESPQTKGEASAADHAQKAPPGSRSDLLGLAASDILNIDAVALVGICTGIGVTFAFATLRSRRFVSTSGEEPLLV